MTAGHVIAQTLLWAGVAAQIVCSVGFGWMDNVFDRLHYAAAATTVGPLLIAVSAALTGAGTSSGTIEVVIACAVLLFLNPIVTHAMGRSARQLVYDDVGPRPEDLARQHHAGDADDDEARR